VQCVEAGGGADVYLEGVGVGGALGPRRADVVDRLLDSLALAVGARKKPLGRGAPGAKGGGA